MKRADIPVGRRLAIGAMVIAVLIAVLGAVVGISVTNIRELQRREAEVIGPRVEAARSVEDAVYEQAIAFRNYALTKSPESLASFRRYYALVGERMALLATMPKTAEGAARFAPLPQAVAAHRDAIETFVGLVRQNAGPEALRDQELVISARRAEVMRDIRGFIAVQESLSSQARADVAEATRRLARTVLLVTLLVIVAAVVMSVFVGRSVREPAARILAAAEGIRRGSFAEALNLHEPGKEKYADELREAGRVFGSMAAVLRAREEEQEARSRFSALLGSTLDARRLAAGALAEIAGSTGAAAGVTYLAEDGGMQPLAAFGLSSEAAVLGAGSGLPGRAITARSLQVARDFPAGAPFTIHLGVDALPPRTVVASPMVVNDRALGALVLAGLDDFTPDALVLLREFSDQLAITLDNALAHARIEQLAGELQQKNEMLQAQNEELQAQGEELQAQSEQLQAQAEELQAQNEELQSQGEELQAQAEELQVQQESLVHANRQLHEESERKNRFLAVLGHELRNPLAAIRGAIELHKDSERSRDAADLEEIVGRQSVHLTRMVDDLLDVSRITSGKIVLERRPVDLRATAARSASLVKPPDGRGPALTVVEGPPVWVNGDETRLEQITTNLLTNAVRHTPHGGHVTVRVRREGEQAVLEVADTGCGIDPDLLPHIFNFLVQGDSAAQQGGLGIGLSLVRTLVELHGGSVEAKSAGRGLGTTLTVRLPAIEAPAQSVPAPKDEPRLPVKRSVVLIEDNPEIRHVMSLILQRAGYQVIVASDGPSGVEAVMRHAPEIALIDLGLPGFDGFEVARRIRAQAPAVTTRLVALSGYGTPEDQARALAAGFDQHLTKPVDVQQLRDVVENP